MNYDEKKTGRKKIYENKEVKYFCINNRKEASKWSLEMESFLPTGWRSMRESILAVAFYIFSSAATNNNEKSDKFHLRDPRQSLARIR